MGTLKYTIIKSKKQYKEYCEKLENFLFEEPEADKDEIELLTLLIEKWDDENNTFKDMDPIQILKALMTQNNLKAKDLVEILGISKGTVSKILNYQSGLSKDSIRKLSAYFKVSQDAFNKVYELAA